MEKEKFNKEPEKLIDPKPRLEHIYNTLGLLEGYTEWKKDLPEKVGPWENSLDLFNNIQKAVLSQVENKALAFRDKTPSVSEISDENIIDALVNNWFEDLPEIRGQRREVLLAVAAHVIRHMETKAYQNILANASKNELEKLGLNSELRDVAVKSLDACMESDLLFIRFLAFSGLSGKTPEKASSDRWYLPNDKTPHTINALFPKETQYISRKFKEISEMSVDWEKIPGGDTFKEYTDVLSDSYQEKDINKISDYYKKVKELYSKSALSDFPILIIPSEYGGGYLKPPYYDPELRVCLKSPECIEAEKGLALSQQIMADCLKNEEYPDLSKNLMEKKIRVVNSIGDYGVNLHSKATAQAGDPIIIMFLNEQIKVHNMMSEIKTFKIENLPEKQSQMMSFFVTLLHEFSHCHKNEDPAFKRQGPKSSVIIDEVKAEQIYRWFVPEIIKRGGIKGTREQWAAAALDLSMEELWDKSEEDSYYYMAVYTLNRILKEGVVEFNFKTRTLSIKDIDAFYKIQEELSKEILDLYEDKSMNPSKAAKWIKENCRPNEIVQKISDFIKKE